MVLGRLGRRKLGLKKWTVRPGVSGSEQQTCRMCTSASYDGHGKVIGSNLGQLDPIGEFVEADRSAGGHVQAHRLGQHPHVEAGTPAGEVNRVELWRLADEAGAAGADLPQASEPRAY